MLGVIDLNDLDKLNNLKELDLSNSSIIGEAKILLDLDLMYLDITDCYFFEGNEVITLLEYQGCKVYGKRMAANQLSELSSLVEINHIRVRIRENIIYGVFLADNSENYIVEYKPDEGKWEWAQRMNYEGNNDAILWLDYKGPISYKIRVVEKSSGCVVSDTWEIPINKEYVSLKNSPYINVESVTSSSIDVALGGVVGADEMQIYISSDPSAFHSVLSYDSETENNVYEFDKQLYSITHWGYEKTPIYPNTEYQLYVQYTFHILTNDEIKIYIDIESDITITKTLN